MTFRKLSEKKILIVQSEVEELIGKKIISSRDLYEQLIGKDGKRLEIYAINSTQWELIEQYQTQSHDVESCGLYLGMILGNW